MSNADIEYKINSDIKAVGDANDGKMRFSGYLAVYGNVDQGGDIIEKGAFAKFLRKAKREGITIPVLEQHGWLGKNGLNPIGYYESLKEDDYGLYAEGVLLGTVAGKDMYTILKESPSKSMGQSIGYWVDKATYPDDEESNRKNVWRIIHEAGLREGSIVTFPMNEKARVENVKAVALYWRQLENHFRDNGFSRDDSKKIISLIKSSGVNMPNLDNKPLMDNHAPEMPQKDAIKGADELLRVLREAKKKSDIANFKNVLKEFSLK